MGNIKTTAPLIKIGLVLVLVMFYRLKQFSRSSLVWKPVPKLLCVLAEFSQVFCHRVIHEVYDLILALLNRVGEVFLVDV